MTTPLPTVRVVCEEPSHEGRRVEVQSFERIENGYWIDPSVWEHDPNRDSISSYTGTVLRNGVPQEPVPNEYYILDAEATDPASGVRRRYDLKCRLCGLSVTARAERLPALLNPLADAGVSVLTLRALARTVS